MKKIVFCFLGLLAVLYTASAQSYTFNHGPYLQELSEHAVTFVFTTSDKGFSWVEVKPDGGEAERHYTVRNGLRDAYNTSKTSGRTPVTSTGSVRSKSPTSSLTK